MARTSLLTTVGALLPAVCAWPAGSGREIAAAHWSCHDTSRLLTPGYDRTGWEEVIERMRKLGVVLSADERPLLSSYLAHNFPPQPQAAARVADGAIWYTGQRSGCGSLAAVRHRGARWHRGGGAQIPRVSREPLMCERRRTLGGSAVLENIAQPQGE